MTKSISWNLVPTEESQGELFEWHSKGKNLSVVVIGTVEVWGGSK